MNNVMRIACAAAITIGCSVPSLAKSEYSELTINVEYYPSSLTGGAVSLTTDANSKNFVEGKTTLLQETKDVSLWDMKDRVHTYYLDAKAATGSEEQIFFVGWYDNKGNLLSDNPIYTTTITTGAGHITVGTKATASVTARFETAVILGDIPSGGSASISSLKNGGEPLTLQAGAATVQWNGAIMQSLSMDFDGWVDANGTLLSTDNPYTFTPQEGTHGLVVSPRYASLSVQPQPGKYYCIRNAANRVLTLEGNYKNEITLGHWTKDENVDATIMRWALAADHSHDDFGDFHYAISDDDPGLEVETAPQTVFYMSGSNNKATFSSQGTDTKAIFNRDFEIHDVNNNMPGYYYLKTPTGTEAGLRTKHTADACYLERGGVDQSKDKINAAMVFQPIDEEHIDQYWIGAKPDPKLYVDNAYWTTMYTAFPYKCCDGMRAYYVVEAYDATGNFALIQEVPGSIVPANTAVLLRCEGLTSKENRMLPLAPDDARIPTVTDNLLVGEFQLNKDTQGNGHKLQDEKMYELQLDEKGNVSFCAPTKTRAIAEGEMKPNIAYLNLASKNPEEPISDKYQILYKELITGIDAINTDNIDPVTQPLYDLKGGRVLTPEAGQIYLLNGHKILWK